MTRPESRIFNAVIILGIIAIVALFISDLPAFLAAWGIA